MNLLQYVKPLQGTASNYEYFNGNTLPLVARSFSMAAWKQELILSNRIYTVSSSR